jgi:hypothetical protein
MDRDPERLVGVGSLLYVEDPFVFVIEPPAAPHSLRSGSLLW